MAEEVPSTKFLTLFFAIGLEFRTDASNAENLIVSNDELSVEQRKRNQVYGFVPLRPLDRLMLSYGLVRDLAYETDHEVGFKLAEELRSAVIVMPQVEERSSRLRKPQNSVHCRIRQQRRVLGPD